jgi:hypothetical protein
MLNKISIIAIPIFIYIMFWIWTNWLINSKIKNKENRKRFKKYFNENISDVFKPIFLISGLIILIFFTKRDGTINDFFNIGYIIMDCILFYFVIRIATIKYEYIKRDIIDLKTKTETEIIERLN